MVKRRVCVCVDDALVAAARRLGVNVSRVCEDALRAAVFGGGWHGLVDALLGFARRDFFDGWGRVFIGEFNRECGLNVDAREAAVLLRSFGYECRLHDGDILLVRC
ncbi:MAG: type II toxin-antitoxin system CcdA family antitoxin [Candidatus Bathyarchaeota archaeon]|nr:type II toxin-antitoxin system CcdA family antitoxin [Candidatus Bathyarchaeota archaeon]